MQCRPASRHGLRPTSHMAPEANSDATYRTHTQLSQWEDGTAAAQPEQGTDLGLQQPQPDASDRLLEGPGDQQTGSDLDRAAQEGKKVEKGTDQGQSEEAGQGQMLLVEAAALGAASPGAVMRVPTSTVLSQADQIALRYQHQARPCTAYSCPLTNQRGSTVHMLCLCGIIYSYMRCWHSQVQGILSICVLGDLYLGTNGCATDGRSPVQALIARVCDDVTPYLPTPAACCCCQSVLLNTAVHKQVQSWGLC